MNLRDVRIPPDLHGRLQLSAWNDATDAERLDAASQIQECLTGRLINQAALRAFGPDDRPAQMVMQFDDGVFDICYSLVPGGTFAPGYDERLIEKLSSLVSRYEPWHADDFNPSALLAWSCRVPCDVRRKPEVRINPFLMATRSVGFGPWNEVEPVLCRNLWDLPTSSEFEWALRGGKNTLFYWGNGFPYFMRRFRNRCRSDFDAKHGWTENEAEWVISFDGIMGGYFAPFSPRSWPRCNRFGLSHLVTSRTWCAPAGELKDEYPLVTRGGAAQGYPWQMCGEWLLFLNAFERRQPLNEEYGNTASIRPIVRFVPAD